MSDNAPSTGIGFPPGPVLVVVDAYVDAEHDAEFNRWYDERHLPAIVACPGIAIGARYRSTDDKEPKYSTLYVVDDEAAMSTDEIAAIRGFDHLTPFVRYDRRIFRPISSYTSEGGLVRH